MKSQEMKMVVAAVIRRGSRFLVGLRPEEKRHGGMWEFPGGKLDRGESLEEGASRELREELGLEVEGFGETLLAVQDPGSEFAVYFLEVWATGEPHAREHSELRWCTSGELQDMPLAPADARFAATLRSSSP